MDRIFVEHLSVKGKHGVSDDEHSREQEFILDIAVEFDTRAAGKSDELTDTVDYGFFRESAQEIVSGKSFRLLEKLADTIAGKILADVRIQTVTVSIRKTELYPDCTPGVTIIRTR
ncbi:dihydroneopterin aldolase [Candidatus Kaiserbacteria bacterium RIFCSPHIGHO2_01_FULL_53_29]|uniref:7,8-dihydroneopterin aldolase n=1 Tax=Candidatus Kaiserbacteria bacterium RIFCSPHIGHO2_01_FULL_53_29 TaxID=1798480 RepID=A0A1F6CUL6_9BACT|nr:MAG: dihydroneopterin aldolase [Candidatus Kaiserbacteria bacterium RIFCSPHIGHO2_01_FULL_53_29]